MASYLKGLLKLRSFRTIIWTQKRNYPKRMDPYALATGPERGELLQHDAGNWDCYNVCTIDAQGTRECPTEIPSACEERVLGCDCPDDCLNMNWLMLYKDEPRRCGCGHWFVLVHKEPWCDS